MTLIINLVFNTYLLEHTCRFKADRLPFELKSAFWLHLYHLLPWHPGKLSLECLGNFLQHKLFVILIPGQKICMGTFLHLYFEYFEDKEPSINCSVFKRRAKDMVFMYAYIHKQCLMV